MKNTKQLLLLAFLMLPIFAFCQNDKQVKVKDGIIHYKVFGQGEPILIINGGPGLDCEGFVPLAKLLSDKYQTILFDQRGNGGSTLNHLDSTTITMKLMAEDIEAIRKDLNIHQWIILGHSFGGWMAEYYATQYPESIKAMILSSSAGVDLKALQYLSKNIQMHLSQQERDSLAYYKTLIEQGDTTYTTRFNKSRILASAYVYDKKYLPAIAKRMANGQNTTVTNLVYDDLYRINFDCKETLKDFDKPVLIIQGRQDITGAGIAYETKAVFKNSTIKFINECAHYSWLAHSDEYKAEVEGFITKLHENS